MRTSASKSIIFLIPLLKAVTCLAGQGVSPGLPGALIAIDQRCPTFNWEVVDGADFYEIVAFGLPEHLDDEAALEAEMGDTDEVLYATVAGGASGWTPSAEQCLEPGQRYVWFVRAAYETAADDVVDVGEWSHGRYFAISAAPSAEDVAQALEVLQRYVETGGEAGPGARSSLAAASAVASPASRHAGSGAPKSVPSADAAIRGENPSAGESYGVIGTSASFQGAGVGAANTAGGPDLVLDGSADGVADTHLWELGLDRPSGVHETFMIGNSGAGRLHLEVEGDLTANVLRGEEVVVTGVTVIDDAREWQGAGSTVPCPSCVTSSDIADGSINDNDLSDDAVTETKIEGGAVTSSKILDGTITAADLDLTSGIYASKSQLYAREEALELPAIAGLFSIQVYCDDANDLPLTGSCDINSTGGVELVGNEDRYWTDPAFPAEWTCMFFNRLAGTTTVRSRIVCISVQ